jgi:hypothetical protein
MANLPSLKLRKEAALEDQQRRNEKKRQETEAKAKALKDAEVADAQSTEESETESSSDDSDSDDGDESNLEAGSDDDVEMGGMGTQASAKMAQKPKAKVNFSGLNKKFSKGLAGRR